MAKLYKNHVKSLLTKNEGLSRLVEFWYGIDGMLEKYFSRYITLISRLEF